MVNRSRIGQEHGDGSPLRHSGRRAQIEAPIDLDANSAQTGTGQHWRQSDCNAHSLGDILTRPVPSEPVFGRRAHQELASRTPGDFNLLPTTLLDFI